jgi:hypothetical protein
VLTSGPRVLQGCSKGVTRVLYECNTFGGRPRFAEGVTVFLVGVACSIEGVTVFLAGEGERMLRVGVTVTLLECHKYVTRVLQECCKGVTTGAKVINGRVVPL